MTHAPDFGPLMLRVAEATMIPTHGASSQARAVDSSPPAPSSGAPRGPEQPALLAEPSSARPQSDADPAGSGPFAGLAGESQCPVCHGDQVVPVGPRDWSGQQHVTDCPVCAYPKENT